MRSKSDLSKQKREREREEKEQFIMFFHLKQLDDSLEFQIEFFGFLEFKQPHASHCLCFFLKKIEKKIYMTLNNIFICLLKFDIYHLYNNTLIMKYLNKFSFM